MTIPRLCLTLAALVPSISSDAAQPSFYASFDSLTADFAQGGDSIRVSDQFPSLDLVTFPPGQSGAGLQLTPDQWCAVPLAGNLSFDEGALSNWFRADGSGPTGKAAKEFLFDFDTRTGDAFGLYLTRGKSPALHLRAGNEKSAAKTFDFPLGAEWKSGDWHQAVVRWKRGESASIEVDGGPATEFDGVALPDIAESEGRDLFVGSNAAVRAGRGGLENFVGTLDELTISTDRGFDFSRSAIPPKIALAPPPELPWVLEYGHRVLVHVRGVDDERFESFPVKAAIPVAGLEELGKADLRRLMDSIRLVRSDAAGEVLPFEAAPDDAGGDEFEISFIHRGTADAWYAVYFDPADSGEGPLPRVHPMIGNASKVRIGEKGTIGNFSAGISGAFDVADFDGDGDWDILANSGTSYVRRGMELNYGIFFYDGLAKDTGIADLVASPRRVASRNVLTGPIAGKILPSLGDINGDGSLDVVYLGDETHEWWELDLSGAKPEVTAMHELPLLAAPPDNEVKTTVYDYDKDGLLDLVVGFLRVNPVAPGEPRPEIIEVYRNVGTATEPLFDNRDPIRVDLPDHDKGEWHYAFIDLDADGDDDLVSSNFLTRFFTYTNTGTASNPVYTDRRELLSFDGHEIENPQPLNYVRAIDWDHDGDADLLFTGENTRLGLLENIAAPGAPAEFRQPTWIQQEDAVVDVGSIAIPVVVDLDHDGDLDIVSGSANANLHFVENVGNSERAVWSRPTELRAGGTPIDLRPGPEGSVQFELENDWGYNNPEVGDWDGDGRLDLVAQGNRMEHVFFKNIGSSAMPWFARGELLRLNADPPPPLPPGIRFDPQPGTLVTAHRSRPAMVDWDGDGLMDYVALDSESIPRVYLRKRNAAGELELTMGYPLELTGDHDGAIAIVRQTAEEWTRPGYAGRTVINAADWDGDGDTDLVLNNINGRLYENVTGNVPGARFEDRGNLAPDRLSAHNCGPEIVDWDGDGLLDMFVGTEEGQIYFFSRAYIEHGNLTAIVYPEETRTTSSSEAAKPDKR